MGTPQPTAAELLDRLLARIALYSRATGIAPTTLGKRLGNHSDFEKRIRARRNITFKKYDEANAKLDELFAALGQGHNNNEHKGQRSRRKG